MGQKRVTQKVLTSKERNELVYQLEREQDLLIETLVAAQARVEVFKKTYNENKIIIQKLNEMKVFEDFFTQNKVKKVS